MTARRVLIAEDDPDIARTLARGFKMEGYSPVIAGDRESALGECEAERPSAAVGDMMLGDDRGDDLVRCLRERGMHGPILMLSALTSVDDRATGMNAGADDYIAKPFDFNELMTRLRVQETLRERANASQPILSLGAMTYDTETRTVKGETRRESLTEREGDLLCFLLARAGKVTTRGEIYDTLWARDSGGSENVVDVYLGYLRRKLAPMSDFGIALKTIRSRGFLLTESDNEI